MLALLALLFAMAAPGAQAPPCFGAAARDPERACSNDALERTVSPSPARARTLPNSPCRTIETGSPPVCRFGPVSGTETFALVGDSHAGHWRAAFQYVANAKNWSGLSITRSSCPLQKALRDLREPRRTQCRRWKDDVFAWFAAHPEVRTVFVAGLSGGSGVVPSPRRSRFATSVQGYLDAWAALPGRRIVVLRDTPRFKGDTDVCVSRAARRREQVGTTCAVSRRFALRARSGDRRRGARRSGDARPDTVLLWRALLPRDRRRARRPRCQPHDRDLLGHARAVRPARARPPHGDVTASVNVSGFV